MTLLSALDDLLTRTLSAIPGALEKLEYLCSLRQNGGRYSHWGLSHVHGEKKAVRALGEAHKMLVSEVLETPLRTLMEETQSSCDATERKATVYLEVLASKSPKLAPEDSPRSSTRHLSSVLHALSALARARQRATHPNA